VEMAIITVYARVCDQSTKFYLPAGIINDTVSQMNISML